MATIGSIGISMWLNKSRLDKGLSGASLSLTGFAKSATGAGLALAGLNTAMGLVHLGQSVVTSALETEKAMTGLQKATDLGPAGVAALKGELQQLSTTIPGVKVEDLYSIATAGAKLGVAAPDLAKYAAGVAKVSLAIDDLPAAEIADQIGKVNSVFKLGVAGTEQLGSAIDKLADSGVSSASSILAVTQRISGTASAARISAPEATALAAALLDTGTQAELGATTLQRLIMGLNDVGAQKGFADAIGVSAAEFARQVEASPIKAIQDFLAALSRMDAAAQQTAIKAIGIDGAQAAGEIQKLSQQTETVTRYVGLANHEFATLNQLNSSLALETERVGGSLQIASNHIGILSDKIGTALLPVLGEAVSLFNELATSAETPASGLRGFLEGALSAIPGFQLMQMQGRAKEMVRQAHEAAAAASKAEQAKKAAAKAEAVRRNAAGDGASLAGGVDAAKLAAAGSALSVIGSRTAAVMESIRSPAEKLDATMMELNALYSVGALSLVDYSRAMAAATAESDALTASTQSLADLKPVDAAKALAGQFAGIAGALPGAGLAGLAASMNAAALTAGSIEPMLEQKDDRSGPKFAAAMELGSQEARSTLLNFRANQSGDPIRQVAKTGQEQLKAQNKANELLTRIAANGAAGTTLAPATGL